MGKESQDPLFFKFCHNSILHFTLLYTLSRSYLTIFAARALRDAHMVTFFLQISIFQILRQISQNQEQIRTPCFR